MNPAAIYERTSANPAAARTSAAVKVTLDHYLVFVGRPSGREVEAREIAVEMLEQFMASDREFRQWQKRTQASVFESRESRIEKGRQMNGQIAE